jgi:tetratricopeptide (TPR) repeat protein
MYFDAERYQEATQWYEQALKIQPNDANVSTDLGVAYYYTDQPDRAIQQFEQSLRIDPKHTKTMLNMGIVKAFGKQDLAGAAAAWQQVIATAPDSQEAQAAKKALEGLQQAHPGGPASGAPGS